MNRKTFALAALSLLALAACNAQADVTMEGAESSVAMEETTTSEAPAMMEESSSSSSSEEAAAMEGEVVEIDAGAAMEAEVQ